MLCDASAIASCSFASVAASTAAAPFACAVSSRAAARIRRRSFASAQRGEIGGRAFEHAAELEDVVAQRRMIGDQLTPRRRDPGTQLVRHVDARAAPVCSSPRATSWVACAPYCAPRRIPAQARAPARAGRPGAVEQRRLDLAHHHFGPAPCRHRCHRRVSLRNAFRADWPNQFELRRRRGNYAAKSSSRIRMPGRRLWSET